ncbi:MAG: hypothetical protein HOB14_12900 [Gammaproteobacteria bacterium]|jgi:methyl-accepting chemotaxis protein|nr:hypothetical protein [Gammaproteobacteria bacterium]MBT6702553.1 hypothetical protein [Gammaproteobacteria bacterium]
MSTSEVQNNSQISLDTGCMERLADTFESSAKRWELVVYPSMVAFVVLAVYGFYLIYTLSRDVHNMTLTLTTLTISVDRNMNDMTNSIRTMDHTMVKLGNNIGNMDGNIQSMTQNVATMTQNTNAMATSTYYMQRNIRDVARPMNIMSRFMP